MGRGGSWRHGEAAAAGLLDDKLSCLPEDARREIVSWLPTHDAVKMGMMSREWKSICSSLENLIFDEDLFPNVRGKLEHFNAFIWTTLCHYGNSNIKKMCIKFRLSDKYPTPVLDEGWITYALEHNVETLDMRINLPEKAPSNLFNSASLKWFKLETNSQKLSLPETIFLPNLKDMTLSAIAFSDAVTVVKLFSGCPVLESLVISGCNVKDLVYLGIDVPTLRHLHIVGCHGVEKCMINVNAPRLQTFIYDGQLALDYEFCHMGASNIILHEDGEDGPSPRSREVLNGIMWRLVEGLQHSRSLRTNLLFFQILSVDCFRLLTLGWFLNLQQLQVVVWPTERHIKMLLLLLGKMPQLKRLHITITGKGMPRVMPHIGPEIDERYLVGNLSNLRHVQILNYEGLEIEMMLMRYLLLNASSLIDMGVSVRTVRDGDEPSLHYVRTFLEIAEQLLYSEFGCPIGHWIINYDVHHLYLRCKVRR